MSAARRVARVRARGSHTGWASVTLVELTVAGGSHESPSVQHAALITVGNIVTGDDDQTQVLINHGVLSRLRKLLSHSKKSILKDACFTLSNIAAGNKEQIQAIIDARIVPALVMLYNTSNKPEVRIEATWALANALSNGSDEQIRYAAVVALDARVCV